MWQSEIGKNSDVVLTSRVRLARNIKDIPFEKKMSEQNAYDVIERCKNILSDFKFIDLSKLSEIEKKSYVEKHLISAYMISNDKKRGILLNDKSDISVMLLEEDHLRVQSMVPGFDLDLCYKKASETDDRIEKEIEYAFSEKFGYLTSCPTNVGTGMRASVMMHLPGLVLTKKIDSIIQALSKLSVAVRGIYGEGSKALGNIFQISNQVTLGVSEEEILQKMNQIVTEIIDEEKKARQSIYEKNKYALSDRILRSTAVLKGALMLSSNEMMTLLSDLRLGINLGIIENIDLEKVNSAMYKALPATITAENNITAPIERDLKRAEIMKEYLN